MNSHDTISNSTEKDDVELTDQIRQSIKNPMLSFEYMMAFAAGEHQPPENAVNLSNLSIEKVKRFYEIVKRELLVVEEVGETQFSHWLEEDLHPSQDRQSTFDHEIEHVVVADSLGVDLERSQLQLFFLTDGFGLQITHSFHPPDDIEPWDKLRIALAPETLSSGDIQVIKSVLAQQTNDIPDILDKAPGLQALIEEKAGQSLSELIR